MDHSDLVAELPRIEKLTAAERLRIARDRRINQLMRFDQYERDLSTKREKVGAAAGQRSKRASKARPVKFIDSVMLLEAAARNDIDEVRGLLMQGINPDGENDDGLTALHQCCIDDSEDMMKLLIDFGANVNAEDSEKWTPLHAAATCGHLHLVKYLISKGANLLAVNADGNMPYDICEDEPTLDYIESEMAQRGVTQELIDQTRASTERKMLADLKQMASRGESLEFRDSVGATPLHVAAANGYVSVVEFLLDQHVSTDAKDNDGWQAIHAGSCWGHLEVVELLVQNGADLNAQTNNHETPFDICEDPEMKSRLAALRSEQESRARADHQRNRRSQSASTNTRTHSIRRNSTRDKGQISKKQIKNEAIIGIQNDGSPEQLKVVTDGSGQEKPIPSVMDPNVMAAGQDKAPKKPTAPLPPSSSSNRRPENGSSSVPRYDPAGSKPHYISSQPYLTASALSDNTIDIRVSVTINTVSPSSGASGQVAAPPPPPPSGCMSLAPSPSSPPLVLDSYVPSSSLSSGGSCTLSDLKKQRAQCRLVGPPVFNSSGMKNPFLFPALEEFNSPPGGYGSGVNGHSAAKSRPSEKTNTHQQHQQQPPSGSSGAARSHPAEPRRGNPSQQHQQELPKFQGETAELVGDKNRESTSCCVMS